MPLDHGLQTMALTISLLQYKNFQIYNEQASFWMALPSQRRSRILGNVLLGAEFWLIATNFIYILLHDGVVSVCMHACPCMVGNP